MDRVIIFAPNWLGDAVMALPAIADVRRGSPRATIAVAARRSTAPLFEMVPDVDEVVVLENGVASGPFFDTAILLPNSFHAAVSAARAAIPERWGYRTDWRGLFLTRAIDRPPAGTHQVEYYQHLVRALGFSSGPGEPRLDVSPEMRAAGRATLEHAGWDGLTPLVAIAPGAAYGGSRRWPSDRFTAVARALADEGVRPVLLGSPADAATGSAVESAIGRSNTILNLIGRTDVPMLTGVLANVRALISNDSGAMHLGAAVGTPLTALLGPTDEQVTGPRSRHRAQARISVFTNSVWCRPCTLRECPLDHACMKNTGAAAVIEAVRQML